MRLSPKALPSFLACTALLGLLALTGCGGDPNEEASQCPKPYLLPDAAQIARFRGPGHDLADLETRIKITDVQGACVGKIGVKLLRAHAHLVMLVSRGPASHATSLDIPYSVGVVLNGDIQAEKTFVQHVDFPPNVNNVEVTGQEIPFNLPTAKTISGPNYHLYFWLQLTPEELAANRAHP